MSSYRRSSQIRLKTQKKLSATMMMKYSHGDLTQLESMSSRK